MTAEGSFPLFYIAMRATGARLVCVPLKDYTFDLDAMARAVTPKTRLIIIANPNNPTGTMFTADAFAKFLDALPDHVVVLLDEAYCDYVSHAAYSRSVQEVLAGRNVVVLRTFSKIYGLAGIRLGYAIGPPALLAEMNKIRLPFNTSGVAQAAAFAALDDIEHVRRSIESNRAGMTQLEKGFAALGVKYVPSFANFTLVELGIEAGPITDEMLKLGVIVRPMRWMGFPSAFRVTIGTREENEKFLAALAQVLTTISAKR